MVDIFKYFEVNDSLAEDGIWVDFVDGGSFKIRSSTTPAFKKSMGEYEKKLFKLRKLHRNDIPDDLQKDAYSELLYQVISDWKGMTSNGKDLPFNEQNLRNVLKIEQVAKFIAAIADDFTLFQTDDNIDITEDEEKNS